MRIAEQLQTIAENQLKVYDAGADHFGLKKTVKSISPLVLKNVHHKEHKISVDIKGASKTLIKTDSAFELSEFSIPLGTYAELKNVDEISISYSIYCSDVSNVGEFHHGVISYGAVDYFMYSNHDIVEGSNEFNNTFNPNQYLYDEEWGYGETPSDNDVISFVCWINTPPQEGTIFVENIKAIYTLTDYSSINISNGVDTFTFNENGIAKVKSISPETTLTLSDDNIEFGAEYFVDTANIIDSNKVLL